MSSKWDEVAREAWANAKAREEQAADYVADLGSALLALGKDVPPGDRASVARFLVASNKPPHDLMRSTPALFVIARRVLWRLQGLDDEVERLTLMGAALSLAYTAGQHSLDEGDRS